MYSPTLGWRDVDLAEPLQAATRLPVVVENSVKACMLAQVWAVTGDAPVDGPVAFVNVSDGVGVGIAVDGKLLRGAHNIAGEFGHVAAQHGRPALLVRPARLLGGVRLQARDHRALPGHGPVLVRLVRARRAEREGHRRAGAGRRGARDRDAARDRRTTWAAASPPS